jgi:hypothetical protein
MSELDAETRQEYLSDVSTEELIAALVSREGVQMFTTQPDVKYVIEDEDRLYENGDGPVTIITVDGA